MHLLVIVYIYDFKNMSVNFQLYETFDIMINNTSVEIREETSLPGPRTRSTNHSTDVRKIKKDQDHYNIRIILKMKQIISLNFISVKLL